jgi:predicted AAA+ superfamily ATPase
MERLMGRLPLRHTEKMILESMVKSKHPEFLALYGRRRVGKTHLIRTYFAEHKDILYFDVAGIKNGPMAEQITNFTRRLGEVFYGGAPLAAKKNWNETFDLLTKAIAKQTTPQKIVVFIDECPWLASKNSRLLQQLDYYWNQYWSKDKRIILILCGSSASWIIDKIVNNRGGLHNRITRTIHLEPLDLAQTKSFLHERGVKLEHSQLLQIYMVTGGVAYYLMQVEQGRSAAEVIDQLAFKHNGPLLNEFDNLFASLFENADDYVKAIRFIANYQEGTSKEAIFKHLGAEFKGKKGLYLLKALEDAGFILSFTPHMHQRRGTYYKVIDEYTLFYLCWIEPVKNTLLKRSLEDGYWQIQQTLPAWRTWSGFAFEAVVYKHVRQIRKALKLSPADIPTSWRYVPRKASHERGAQIDLLFYRNDHAITLCEIKYTDKAFTITKEYADVLLRKMVVFKQRTGTDKQLFMCIISANGIQNNYYADDLISRVVTLDDLFL